MVDSTVNASVDILVNLNIQSLIGTVNQFYATT